MSKQYTFPEDKPVMVNEDAITYPQGVTIPITLPTTGECSVEYLKNELTEFAMTLIRRATPKQALSHTSWRNLKVSDKVKAMSLGPSCLSADTRSDKELLTEALEQKYQ